MAMRSFYECGIIKVGVIITREAELNEIFKNVYDYDSNSGRWKPIKRKYGASTTWIGKLLPRLDSRRNGGCPIVAIGIKKECVSDWYEGYKDEHSSENN